MRQKGCDTHRSKYKQSTASDTIALFFESHGCKGCRIFIKAPTYDAMLCKNALRIWRESNSICILIRVRQIIKLLVNGSEQVSGIKIVPHNNFSDPRYPKSHEINTLSLRNSAITDYISHNQLRFLSILILVMLLDFKYCL